MKEEEPHNEYLFGETIYKKMDKEVRKLAVVGGSKNFKGFGKSPRSNFSGGYNQNNRSGYSQQNWNHNQNQKRGNHYNNNNNNRNKQNLNNTGYKKQNWNRQNK